MHIVFDILALQDSEFKLKIQGSGGLGGKNYKKRGHIIQLETCLDD